MINIIQYPYEIAFSRKPMLVQGVCVDINGAQYGEQMLSVFVEIDNNGFQAGSVLTVTVTENAHSWSQSFEAKVVQSGPNDIPIFDASWNGNKKKYMAAIASIISSNPFLSPKISVRSTTAIPNIFLKFFAKSIDIQVAITVNAAVMTTNQINSYIADNTPPNYTAIIEIYLERGFKQENYELAGSVYIDNIEDGAFSLDISEVLHGALIDNMYFVELPAWSSNIPIVAPNQRGYFIRYKEQIGVDNVQGNWQFKEKQVVFRGGDSIFNTNNYFSNIDKRSSILNNYPDRKIIDTKQPEWLAWINYTRRKEAIIAIFTQYDANNIQIAQSINTNGNSNLIEPFEILLFPVGHTQTLLLGNCVKYTVQLLLASDQTDAAPLRTFYIDNNCYDDTKYLQYLNSFGIPETLRCKGHFTKALQVNRSLSESYSSGIIYYGYEQQTDESQETIYTYRTGFITAAEKETLQEMLIYNHLWEVENNGALGVLIQDTKFKVYQTWENLKSYEINCKVKVQEKNYFNNKKEPQYLAWQMANGGYWLTNDEKPWLLGR